MKHWIIALLGFYLGAWVTSAVSKVSPIAYLVVTFVFLGLVAWVHRTEGHSRRFTDHSGIVIQQSEDRMGADDA